MDISNFIILIASGFFIGLISVMVGIGGGLLTVPVLMFFFGLNNPTSSAVSTLVIVATSSVGAYTYWKQNRIDLQTGRVFALCAVPAAFVGGVLADTLEAIFLNILFGSFLIIVAVRKILFDKSNSVNDVKAKQNSSSQIQHNAVAPSYEQNQYSPDLQERGEERLIVDNKGVIFHYRVQLGRTLIGAMIGSFIGGLFGVGGGIIYVPILTLIGGLPAHIAVATSTFTIVFSALSGSIARIIGGKVLYDYVVALAIGTIFGARIGALKVRKISSKHVLNAFYALVLLAGVNILLSIDILTIITNILNQAFLK
jgi:hypothetical protein